MGGGEQKSFTINGLYLFLALIFYSAEDLQGGNENDM